MYGTIADSLLSLLRNCLMLIAGIIVAKGWISGEEATQLVGALVGLISVLFSIFFHAASNGTVQTLSTTPNMLKHIDAQLEVPKAEPST